MAVRLWTKRQQKKTDREIPGPKLVFPSTVQCRTQVSMGGQGIAGMEEYWGCLSQLSGRKGPNFQSMSILSGPGHMPSPGEQRSSATRKPDCDVMSARDWRPDSGKTARTSRVRPQTQDPRICAPFKYLLPRSLCHKVLRQQWLTDFLLPWSKMNLTLFGQSSRKFNRVVHQWTAKYAAGHHERMLAVLPGSLGSAS